MNIENQRRFHNKLSLLSGKDLKQSYFELERMVGVGVIGVFKF